MANKIAGIRFGCLARFDNFLSDNLELKRGNICIVEGDKTEEMGEVVTPPHDPPANANLSQLKRVLRIATKNDLDRFAENTKSEKKYLRNLSKR